MGFQQHGFSTRLSDETFSEAWRRNHSLAWDFAFL
jgi:hypothetical protein